MKKNLLLLSFLCLAVVSSMAQTVIYNNGPLFNLPNGGSGGANASTLYGGLTTYGAGHAVSSGFRVADDFVIPAGSSWTIDSLIFFAYQTGSGNISTIDALNVRIWDGIPGDVASNIVFGDVVTNLLLESVWTGTYRTGDVGGTCAPATCVDRPIMRNQTETGVTLGAGTYWVDWQTGGSGASGPWAPPLNPGLPTTSTGNSMQFSGTTLAWTPLADLSLTTEFIGLPFLVIGSVLTSVHEIGDAINVSIFPNPMSVNATVSMQFQPTTKDDISFKVYDVLGNLVREVTNIKTQQFIFERNAMNNGVYLYEVLNQNKVVKNGKLIIQ